MEDILVGEARLLWLGSDEVLKWDVVVKEVEAKLRLR